MKLILVLIIYSTLLTSCIEKKVSNPEATDLIVLDIKKDIASTDKVIKLRNTEIEIVKGEMDSLTIRDPERKAKEIRIMAMKKDVIRFIQLKKYFEIKLRKRKVYSKILYEKNYTDKKEWPDQKEFDTYLIGKNNSHLPIKEINKADNSRQLTHKKDVNKILESNGIKK